MNTAEYIAVADYAQHFGLERRVDEIVAFRRRLADAYAAAGLRTGGDLYAADDLTDAAVAYVKDPAYYGMDPLRTLVLHERLKRLLCGRDRAAATQEQIEALEDEICAVRGEPPPIRFSPEEKAELHQKVQAAVAAMKQR
jgi:hypothetical protein